MDVEVFVNSLNAIMCQLVETELHTRAPLAVPTNGINNRDLLVLIGFIHKLFLMNTAHYFTFIPLDSDDNTAIGRRCRGSVEDFRSLGPAPVDSDHILVRPRFLLRLSGVDRTRSPHKLHN